MTNFTLLDGTLPDVARPLAAMVQAPDAVGRRSWSQPQEPTSEDWWADVLADTRARRRKRRASDHSCVALSIRSRTNGARLSSWLVANASGGPHFRATT